MMYELTFELAAPARFTELIQWHRAKPGNFQCQNGRFDGIWTCEFGVGNRVCRLRAFDDVGEWASGQELPLERFEPDSAPTPAHACLQSAERRLLRPVRALRPDLDFAAGLCELRIYDVLPGSLPAFVEAMLAIMPLRERYSANAGVWQPLTGSMYQLVHMWYYANVAQRTAAREAVIREPAWQDYRKTVLPLVTRVQSCILSPVKVC
jgi:NIPSNAP